MRLLGGSHSKCHRKTGHPPGVSVRKRHQAQPGKQPALPVPVPADSTWPQSSAGSGGNLLQQQGLREHTPENVRRDLKTGALIGGKNRTISPCPGGESK